MEIKRVNSGQAPADYFTGDVRIRRLNNSPEPARAEVAEVTFAAGARTAWHTHPLGQTLIVTEGKGWAQSWDGPVQEINEGDTVWFSPDEKHWHGATRTSGMVHIAIQEKMDGSTADWLEQVSDEQYQL